MKKKITILFIIVFLISCKNEVLEERKVFSEEKIGKDFLFPKESKVIYADKFLFDSISVFKLPLKVVTYVDFNCGYCYNELIELKKFLNSFNEDKIGLVVYGYSELGLSGYYTFITYYPDFPFPIFIDTKSKYLEINAIPVNDRYLHTFLIDKDDKIVLIGNPLEDSSTMAIYTKELEKFQLKL